MRMRQHELEDVQKTLLLLRDARAALPEGAAAAVMQIDRRAYTLDPKLRAALGTLEGATAQADRSLDRAIRQAEIVLKRHETRIRKAKK